MDSENSIVNVIIEITANSAPVKYEIDKDSGILAADRFLPLAMHYPCDYGYIPNTLSSDGDPLDVLVITPYRVQPGCSIKCRILGVLNMEDEAGTDNKILALPTQRVCKQLAHINTLSDLPKLTLDSIAHFFKHYKDFEPEKYVRVHGWEGKEQAERELINSIERYKAR